MSTRGFNRGVMNHPQYHHAVIKNAKHLANIMPGTASEIRPTGLPATGNMTAKTHLYLQEKRPIIINGSACIFPSNQIKGLPATFDG